MSVKFWVPPSLPASLPPVPLPFLPWHCRGTRGSPARLVRSSNSELSSLGRGLPAGPWRFSLGKQRLCWSLVGATGHRQEVVLKVVLPAFVFEQVSWVGLPYCRAYFQFKISYPSDRYYEFATTNSKALREAAISIVCSISPRSILSYTNK